VRREAQHLTFAPRLPATWPSCEIQYRYGETLYRINIRQTLTADTTMSVLVDGVAQSERSVLLVDDHQDHVVDVAVGAAPAAASEHAENGRPVVPRQRGTHAVIASTDS
jgi:cyclic beta-1,2-glucan glucanotransferase